MNTYIVDAPLAHNAQVQLVDSIEAVLWTHTSGHIDDITTLATIDALIKEYRY
jgi:hypothetical protein